MVASAGSDGRRSSPPFLRRAGDFVVSAFSCARAAQRRYANPLNDQPYARAGAASWMIRSSTFSEQPEDQAPSRSGVTGSHGGKPKAAARSEPYGARRRAAPPWRRPRNNARVPTVSAPVNRRASKDQKKPPAVLASWVPLWFQLAPCRRGPRRSLNPVVPRVALTFAPREPFSIARRWSTKRGSFTVDVPVTWRSPGRLTTMAQARFFRFPLS